MQKRINKNGSLTIPKALRVQNGLHSGTVVDITAEGRTITIMPVHATCFLCGGMEDLQGIFGRHICPKCARIIIGRFMEDTDHDNE